jgi:hypothetical protein
MHLFLEDGEEIVLDDRSIESTGLTCGCTVLLLPVTEEQLCAVCYEEFPNTQFLKYCDDHGEETVPDADSNEPTTGPNNQNICKECLKKFCEVQLERIDHLFPLKCPGRSCTKRMTYEVLCAVIGEERFQELSKLPKKRFLHDLAMECIAGELIALSKDHMPIVPWAAGDLAKQLNSEHKAFLDEVHCCLNCRTSNDTAFQRRCPSCDCDVNLWRDPTSNCKDCGVYYTFYGGGRRLLAMCSIHSNILDRMYS